MQEHCRGEEELKVGSGVVAPDALREVEKQDKVETVLLGDPTANYMHPGTIHSVYTAGSGKAHNHMMIISWADYPIVGKFGGYKFSYKWRWL